MTNPQNNPQNNPQTNPQTEPLLPEELESIEALLSEEAFPAEEPLFGEDTGSPEADLPAVSEEAAAISEELPGISSREKHGRFERPQTPAAEAEGSAPPNKSHSVLRKILRVLLIVVIVLGLLALGGFLWLNHQYHRGKEQLKIDYEDVAIQLPTQAVGEEEEEQRVITYDDGKTVNYNGKTYRLNENLATILFMGIDRHDLEAVELYGTGGQADVILLLALDTKTGDLNILNIPRETYAEYELYFSDGTRIGFETRQICLAYAYGDGRESSCLNTYDAVSRLLYGMPISKYLALDIDGIVAANDSIGGVTLTSLEELEAPDGTYIKGDEEITLLGKTCEWYIRIRQRTVDGNVARMARQKQYIQAFTKTLIQKAKSNFSVIPHLFRDMEPYYVTDLDLSDLIFLAGTYLAYHMNMQFSSFGGTYDLMENNYGKNNAVYYPDEESLFEAVLNLFYVPVED